jgi:3-oxoadipate enol-lactonase
MLALDRQTAATSLISPSSYLSGREILFNGQGSQHIQSDNRLNFPIVLLRGLGRSSAFWLEFGDNLSTSARVIMLDLKGTGKSQPKSGLNLGRGTVEGHGNDVLETLNHLGVQNCHLVGISFGGMIAAYVAGVAQLKSVTIIASSARFTQESRIQKAALWKLLAELYRPYPRHKMLAEYLVSPRFLHSSPHIVHLWDSLCQTEGFKRIPVFRQLLGAGLLSGKKEFSEIACPSLFVVSKNDALVDWRNSAVLWQTAPKAKLLYMEGYGHDIPTEAPIELSQRLAQFMSRVEKNAQI